MPLGFRDRALEEDFLIAEFVQPWTLRLGKAEPEVRIVDDVRENPAEPLQCLVQLSRALPGFVRYLLRLQLLELDRLLLLLLLLLLLFLLLLLLLFLLLLFLLLFLLLLLLLRLLLRLCDLALGRRVPPEQDQPLGLAYGGGRAQRLILMEEQHRAQLEGEREEMSGQDPVRHSPENCQRHVINNFVHVLLKDVVHPTGRPFVTHRQCQVRWRLDRLQAVAEDVHEPV